MRCDPVARLLRRKLSNWRVSIRCLFHPAARFPDQNQSASLFFFEHRCGYRHRTPCLLQLGRTPCRPSVHGVQFNFILVTLPPRESLKGTSAVQHGLALLLLSHIVSAFSCQRLNGLRLPRKHRFPHYQCLYQSPNQTTRLRRSETCPRSTQPAVESESVWTTPCDRVFA